MSRETSFSDFDFEMFYDDWTTGEKINLEEILIGEELALLADKKYPEGTSDEIDERYNTLYYKALALQQKIVMLQYARLNYHQAKTDFELTQNMTIPAFYGLGATKVLFFVETMIILARNALDVSSSVYSQILFDKRKDSFNDFSKEIMKKEDGLFSDLKSLFESWSENPTSVYRLLCGTTHGRALRDIIIHQAVIRLQYFEYKENSEREKLFLLLKDLEPICLDDFIEEFIDGLFLIFRACNRCCELVLNNPT